MMEPQERALISQLIEKVSRLEKRLAVQEQIEQAPGTLTTEGVQDAAFAALTDTATIDFTYNDAANQVTADVKDASVTNAKLANMAQSTVKGRAASAGTGVPTDLSKAQVLTLLNVADGANAYVHPNHSGDVTSVADGATTIGANKVLTAMIADAQLTLAKMADLAQSTIIGRASSAGTGVPTALTKTQVLTLLNVADGADVSGTAITALAAKTTPVDADDIVITDSAASNAPKRVTGTNYKAYFKTYFDTLYELAGSIATHAALTATHGATGAVVGTTNSQTLTNKTLTTPVIGDFTNAAHTHANAANGGNLGAVTATSINFGGTALTNYQEGTWTPTLLFGGGNTSMTFSSQIGLYTRIGNVVHAYCRITLSAKGSSTGAVTMSGLPFAANTGNDVAFVRATTTATAFVYVEALTQASSSTLLFRAATAASTTGGAAIADTDLSVGGSLVFTIIYMV